MCTLYTGYGLSHFYSHPNHQLAQSITASAGVQASKEGRQYGHALNKISNNV